ncbi:MAG: alpha/beta fold hydrolase [Solirubrobacterales bacterium]
MGDFPQDYETFDLGAFALQGGLTLRGAQLAYKTFGKLNADRSNAIVCPTWYSGRHWDNEWMVGDGMALDPAKYFIIIPNILGNGVSSSPSNTPPPYDRARFPDVTFYDQVEAQHKLVTERFGIERLALVTGWSMGAAQSYQWAVSYPDMVERACPFCGSSKTSEHNFVFLEGVKAALTAENGFRSGWYDELPVRNLRAAARVYSGWGFSQAFFWEQIYRDMGQGRRLGVELGFSSLEDFLVTYWEGHFLGGGPIFHERDVNDLLTMLWTWQNGDIGATPGFDGDHIKALKSIKARVIALPAEKDLYFPPEDEEYASQYIPNGEVRRIPGVWGHFAGIGDNPVDSTFIDDVLKELLAS